MGFAGAGGSLAAPGRSSLWPATSWRPCSSLGAVFMDCVLGAHASGARLAAASGCNRALWRSYSRAPRRDASQMIICGSPRAMSHVARMSARSEGPPGASELPLPCQTPPFFPLFLRLGEPPPARSTCRVYQVSDIGPVVYWGAPIPPPLMTLLYADRLRAEGLHCRSW